MRNLFSAIAGVIGGAALFGANSAQATVTLLSLQPVPVQINQQYELSFTANDSATTIWISGYQERSFERVSAIAVTSDAGSNASQTSWTFVPAAKGSNAGEVGTPLSVLWFGGLNEEFDTFSLTYSTTPGADYLLKFYLTNNAFTRNVSALEVTTNAAVGGGQAAIPEASTWLMMLLGFGGLGLAGYGRSLAPRFRPLR
ncbi:MAG TPA: PEP-CTERM sorting domain-containing protein [Roseiarcus sp.]|nr:PEP-CTERM sorting domain-containing protein [Roseiarcus sp.]